MRQFYQQLLTVFDMSCHKKQISKESPINEASNSLDQNKGSEVVYTFEFNKAKKDGFGEDSEPLLIQNKNNGVLGVFDGLGGSGAGVYENEKGRYTGAYIASRLAKQICKDYFNSTSNFENIESELKEKLKNGLDSKLKEYPKSTSNLKSSIIRIFPTTLSIITYILIDNDLCIDSYWAGDSRNFYLNENGLTQISKDDLEISQDPLENLRNDAPISNCICQDRDFNIHQYHTKVKIPCILISATDGCFGYYQTPMNFEMLLLETLLSSANEIEWKENIIRTLIPISGDDFSLSLTMLGLSFDNWKEEMKKRRNYLFKNIISIIDNSECKIQETKVILTEHIEGKEKLINKLWEEYKMTYLPKF